jgi:hypothetical protein
MQIKTFFYLNIEQEAIKSLLITAASSSMNSPHFNIPS